MLRIIEKDDFEQRRAQVEEAVTNWTEVVGKVKDEIITELHSKLMISLIYHDSALEGEVLSHSEIQAVVDSSIITDESLIPSYDEINNFNNATTVALELARQKKKLPLSVTLLKEIYGILQPESKAEGMPYRDQNPLHRLYYHTIAQPEEVKAEMKKFDKWLASKDFTELETIEKAATMHHKFMAIFPWLDGSGRLARILSLFILAQDKHPLAVIHSTDRQAYYEALREDEPRNLMKLYFEAIETTANSSLRVFEEAGYTNRRAS